MTGRLGAAAAVVAGYALLGPVGLVAGAVLAFVAIRAPQVLRVIPLSLLVAMVVVVLAEGRFVQSSLFVDERRLAHQLGLLLALSLGVAVVAEMARSVHGAAPSADRPQVDTEITSTSHGVRLGSVWMLAGAAVLAGGSFIFWAIAARLVEPDSLGAAASLFSSSFFLAYITSLGLPIVVTRMAPDRSAESAWVTRAALSLTVASSVLSAFLFVLVAPIAIVEPIGGRSIASAALMAGVVASVSFSTIVDARLTVWLMWRTYFWRLAAVTVLRLGSLVFVTASGAGGGLFVAAVWAFGLSSLVFLPLVTGGDARPQRPTPETLRRLVVFGSTSYASQLAVQAPLFATPFIVALMVDSEGFGIYYLAWGITSVVLVFVQVIGQALLAESSSRGIAPQKTITALSIGLGIVIVAALLSFVAGGGISAALFGSEFRSVGRLLTPLLVGCAPAVAAVMAVTEARLVHSIRATFMASIPYALFTLAGVGIGAGLDGVDGAARGWAVGAFLSAPFAAWELRQLRSTASIESESTASVRVR